MPRVDDSSDPDLGVLEDKTAALALRSKRTERARKKAAQRQEKAALSKAANKSLESPQGFLDILPYELVMEILTLLRPSDIFSLLRTSTPFRAFVLQEEERIAVAVVGLRYSSLAKCFRLPVLVAQIQPPSIQRLLQLPERLDLTTTVHRRQGYQHIQPPDTAEVCTCLTCTLRWSALAIAVDFAHWQRHLDLGEPIPMIPRGKFPDWNRELVAKNKEVVRKALYSPLWHARVLERHLQSTTRSIARHCANKGNKRRRFRMTDGDVRSGTDDFLDRSGPPSLDFPWHRDNYYLLETFLPNRSWSQDSSRWLYMPAEQHDRDIEFVVRWAERRNQVLQQAEREAREQAATPQLQA
ncbi:hypothetical protein F4777DRAFT_564817 [Nemania sp. FL0916]|nr:hypothetical protein F4777DRAFT_564817 [Nemania sp. FL0916]